MGQALLSIVKNPTIRKVAGDIAVVVASEVLRACKPLKSGRRA